MDELDKKLFEAVEADDVNQINALVEQGAYIHAINNFNETLLEKAKTAEIAELLISNGASLVTDEGVSELFYITIPEVVEVLIAHGADVNAECMDFDINYDYPIYGITPLFKISSTELAKLLISHGANVNAENSVGETPLFVTPSAEIAKILLAHGADVNARNHHGETPLFRTSSADVAKVLLAHGADVNVVNNYGVKCSSYMNAATSTAIGYYLKKNHVHQNKKDN